ncbi:DUF2314 domain-containing protein [Nitrogeniibacter aestuarii]|uniref:DUF2314 domain-containing protein n=1 Tax=Nitrogeniibacter aestuarii TaxID=2815343 RepID=UPI001E3CB958|nr:DUF2314 domain-containing protein [Nitrogeniibacter aestuarii]
MPVLKSLFIAFVCVFSTVTASAPGEPLPGSAWSPGRVGFVIALYHLDAPESDPVAAARQLVASAFPGVTVVDDIPESAEAPAAVRFDYIREDLATRFAPPDMNFLRYFGRGLTREQGEALQQAPSALVMLFVHPAGEADSALRRAQTLAAALAAQGRVVIWDEATREAFSPAAWKEQRIDSWQGDIPDVIRQTTIHAYQSDDSFRAISLGMEKFGLPDLVLEETASSLTRPLGHALNGLAQRLVEGARPDAAGAIVLDARGLKHDRVREVLLEEIQSDGAGKARIWLREARRDDGDPQNALAAMTFSATQDQEPRVAQRAFSTAFFGKPEDQVIMGDHGDDELIAASERARARLSSFRPLVQKGLPPGERFLVKAPFTHADGNEWMWVEVMQWVDDKMTGMLLSDPRFVDNLKTGQTVTVDQGEVFDFMHYRADGSVDGGETNEVLQRQASQR